MLNLDVELFCLMPVANSGQRRSGSRGCPQPILLDETMRCYVGGWLELNSIPEFGTDACDNSCFVGV